MEIVKPKSKPHLGLKGTFVRVKDFFYYYYSIIYQLYLTYESSWTDCEHQKIQIYMIIIMVNIKPSDIICITDGSIFFMFVSGKYD